VDVFRRIALPLARPVVALVAFFALSRLDQLLSSFVMLYNSSSYPLTVGLQDLLEPRRRSTRIGSSAILRRSWPSRPS